MIESLRKEKQAVLLLDCGAVFSPQGDPANSELHLKAMERMGYDALNLGIMELQLGKAFLERIHPQVSFALIASNLIYEGGRLPWIRDYVIKEVGGIKVAILGILDPEDFKKIKQLDHLKGFEAIPPEEALNRLLPEVRKKSDLVVLLSQLVDAKTLALADHVRGIDVTVSSGCSYTSNKKQPKEMVADLHIDSRGMTMGMATITVDDKGSRSISKRRLITLDSSVPDNGEVLGIVETYKKEQQIKKEKMAGELAEGLKLTPEEFMERYRKQQAEKSKGGAQ